MDRITLRTLTRAQGNNQSLLDGTVRPVGFDLDFVDVPVLVQGFRRMVRGLEFDVSEMAATTYLCAREHGVGFTALPIFLARGFHHGAVKHNVRAGLRDVGDLAGRRVGVNRGWTVTTGVWARGILEREYGLDLDSVTWVLSGDEHVQQYTAPANVVHAPAGEDLADMLLNGDIDAAIGVNVEHPDIEPLIAYPEQAALADLASSGLYPINHLIVVKDEVLDAHPDAALAVYDAFAEAKRRYVAEITGATPDLRTPADRLYRQVFDTTGEDPLPYGIEKNRPMLERLVAHAVSQHILAAPASIDDMFVKGLPNG